METVKQLPHLRFTTVFLKLSQAACLRLRSWEKHSLAKMMKGPAMCWTLSRTQTPVLPAGLADKPHLKSFVRTRCGLCIKWRAIITRRGTKPYKDPNLIRSQKSILYQARQRERDLYSYCILARMGCLIYQLTGPLPQQCQVTALALRLCSKQETDPLSHHMR